MKFFVENQEVEKEVENILALIKLRMNGTTVGQMENRGIHYRLNYGVSFQHLKELSLSIKPSYALAERLWFLEIRESMLLAAMLVPQADMDINKALEWSKLIANIDLIERSSMFLWGKLPFAPDLIQQWSTGDTTILGILAMYTLGWHKYYSDQCTTKDIDQLLEQSKRFEDLLQLKAFSFAIRKMLRLTNESTETLNKWVNEALESDSKHQALTAQEIKSEIDFVESDF